MLGCLPDDIFSGSEESSVRKVDEAYRQAEAYIPTQFKSYEEKSREQYFFVKNNYYYLFELAEQVKKRFFQADFCYELKLSTERKAAREIYLDKWRLSDYSKRQCQRR